MNNVYSYFDKKYYININQIIKDIKIHVVCNAIKFFTHKIGLDVTKLPSSI